MIPDTKEKVPGGRIFPPPAVICSPSPKPTVRLINASGEARNCAAINSAIGIKPNKIQYPIFLTSSERKTPPMTKINGRCKKLDRNPYVVTRSKILGERYGNRTSRPISHERRAMIDREITKRFHEKTFARRAR